MIARAALAAMFATACGRIDFAPLADAPLADAPLGNGTFCASLVPVPTFCEDFDNGLDSQKWPASQTLMHNGTFAIDTSHGASPPASLVITSTPLATSADEVTVKLVTAPLGVATTNVSASIALYVDDYGGSGGVVLELVIDDGTTAHVFEPSYATVPQLEDASGPSGQNSTSYMSYDLPAMSLGAWHVVSFDMPAGGNTAAMATVRVDGVAAATFPPLAENGGQVTLYVGMPYMSGPAQAWRLHLDNAVVYVQ